MQLLIKLKISSIIDKTRILKLNIQQVNISYVGINVDCL